MDREELLRALRRMAPETGSLHCLGCGHEHSCSTHGCAVVNAAVLEINMLADQNKLLREQLDESRLPPLTPQKAAGILRDANLGGVLRRAADMGIRALEGMDAANGLDPEEIERILDAYGRGMTLRTENGERLRIIKDIPTNRLQELAQAEKDGRLVVLPCKVGDMLYEVDFPEHGVITCKVVSVNYYNGPWFHVPGNPVSNDLRVEAEVVEGHGKGGSYSLGIDDFGKTVFLTHEEAESALKKREGKDNAAD